MIRKLGLVVLATALSVSSGFGAPTKPAVESEHKPFGIGLPDSDQPISIRADELEAISTDGARHLIFTANVHVEQADIRIESDRLEAFYPKGGNQPDRLVATGHVRLTQNDVEALCDYATYERIAQLLMCEGHAELRDGANRVAGTVIEFDLENEVVKVKGGASVLIYPESGEGEPAAPQSSAHGLPVSGLATGSPGSGLSGSGAGEFGG